MKLVGERRAVAAVVFAFFFIQYLMQAILGGGPTERLMYSLAGCYGMAFFSLVAGYFWARWYSVGVGLFGCILGAIGLWKMGPEFQVILIGGLHLAATVALLGDAMSSVYDGKTGWREKLHMDDSAVQRLGRSVIRAGVSLPIVLAYAFAPKEPATVSLLAAVLATAGLSAVIRLRTWGVLAFAASGGLMMTLGIEHAQVQPLIAGALLLAAAAPFARPMLRLIRA